MPRHGEAVLRRVELPPVCLVPALAPVGWA